MTESLEEIKAQLLHTRTLLGFVLYEMGDVVLSLDLLTTGLPDGAAIMIEPAKSGYIIGVRVQKVEDE